MAHLNLNSIESILIGVLISKRDYEKSHFLLDGSCGGLCDLLLDKETSILSRCLCNVRSVRSESKRCEREWEGNGPIGRDVQFSL